MITSTASRSSFNIFNAALSNDTLYTGDKPPPRKLRRSEPSKCEHAKELQSLWKYIESLAAQVGAFVEATRIQDNQHSINSEDIMASGAMISLRLAILEEKAKLESQSLLPSSRETDNHSCPTIDCVRTFKTQDNLNTHIRQATSYGHMPLQKMINQRFCLPCGQLQPRPQDLINHERSTVHGDSYESRVEKFSMHPKPLRHKHRDGQYLNFNAKRVDRSPTSSPL